MTSLMTKSPHALRKTFGTEQALALERHVLCFFEARLERGVTRGRFEKGVLKRALKGHGFQPCRMRHNGFGFSR